MTIVAASDGSGRARAPPELMARKTPEPLLGVHRSLQETHDETQQESRTSPFRRGDDRGSPWFHAAVDAACVRNNL
jgi:hypothetical protein